MIIIYVLAVFLGLISGWVVAFLCKDELVKGREWFRRVFVFGIVLCVWFALTGKYVSSSSFLFLGIVGILSYIKSFDKKFVK